MIGPLFRLEQCLREVFLRKDFPEYEDPKLRRVARALHSLPAFHRELFCLVRYDGLSYEQIAKRFDITTRRVEIEMARTIALLGRSIRRQERKGW